MSYDPNNLWTEAEDNAISVFYPRHGAKWEGWAEVLPHRTKMAIVRRASSIGASPKRPERPREKKPRKVEIEPYDYVMTPDPHEGQIAAYMEAGMTLSEIDRRMHWYSGTTRRILTEKWDRERNA